MGTPSCGQPKPTSRTPGGCHLASPRRAGMGRSYLQVMIIFGHHRNMACMAVAGDEALGAARCGRDAGAGAVTTPAPGRPPSRGCPMAPQRDHAVRIPTAVPEANAFRRKNSSQHRNTEPSHSQ